MLSQNGARSPHTKSSSIVDQAILRAGMRAAELPLELLDLGLLVYTGGTQPDFIARDEAVPSSATHIRPFFRFNNPWESAAGQIAFELVDGRGVRRFVDQAEYSVVPDENFITPKTWLPLRDQAPSGSWALRITLGETLIAVHTFKWRQVRSVTLAPMIERLQSDGEIDPMRTRAPAYEPLSLEELLSAKEPDHVPEAIRQTANNRRGF